VTFALAAVLAISVAASAGPPRGCATEVSRTSGSTTSWNNQSGGCWAGATNWTPNGTPGNADNVCINLEGTYTVTFKSSDSGSLTVSALAVGGGTGVQTLQLASMCSVHTTLSTSSGTTVANGGVIDLTNSDTCGNNALLVGTVTNGGTIQTDVANGGQRILQGNVTNTGKILANANTSSTFSAAQV
jgi:hypothetical protein